MKEQDIIFQARSEIEAALPSKFSVRTSGDDKSAHPPLCILNWDSSRRSINGHNSFGKVIRDENGNATGRELHRYHLMELDIRIRTNDESERDTLLSDIVDAFLPYEYDPSDFHEDTTEWEIGNPTPRSNPVVEPDWYEGGVTARFLYVSRVEQSADTLTSTQESVDAS